MPAVFSAAKGAPVPVAGVPKAEPPPAAPAEEVKGFEVENVEDACAIGVSSKDDDCEFTPAPDRPAAAAAAAAVVPKFPFAAK